MHPNVTYRSQQYHPLFPGPKILCSRSSDLQQFDEKFAPTWDFSASRLLESVNRRSSRIIPYMNQWCNLHGCNLQRKASNSLGNKTKTTTNSYERDSQIIGLTETTYYTVGLLYIKLDQQYKGYVHVGRRHKRGVFLILILASLPFFY